jgi:tRNA nucleotidyltransferase (CCA-adding enzyme)
MDNGAHIKSFMKMFDQSVCPEDLLLLAKADHLGRVGPGDDGNNMRAAYAETESRLRELLALYRERMSRPYLMGRDLLEAGLKPGPRFHDVLEQTHKLRLAGLSKEEQLKAALALLRGKDGEGGGAP